MTFPSPLALPAARSELAAGQTGGYTFDAMNTVRYSMQCFRDVASRRSLEARTLLDVNPRGRRCDGAVTCALLAAECALKATLLFGYGAAYPDELPEAVHRQAFHGSGGHDLTLLYQIQPQSVRVVSLPEREIRRLSRRHRYRYRYGERTALRSEAVAVLDDSDGVIQWMKRVVT